MVIHSTYSLALFPGSPFLFFIGARGEPGNEATYSYEEQVKMAGEAEETALYAEKKLKELEAEIQQDLWVLRAPASLAVCFKRLNDRNIM